MEDIIEVVQLLHEIEEDNSVHKNVKIRICSMRDMFEKETIDIHIKIDKSLQQLDEISDDPNIPSFVRTQIWSLVSLLESRK